MKRNIFFVLMTLIFSSSCAIAQEKYWYEGCPKYSQERLEELTEKTKNTPVKSVNEWQEHSKVEIEAQMKKAECDLYNLKEARKALESRLKEVDEEIK
ncbi:hypothetical protein B5C26_17995 [Photorhabdus luminescens]|uniref:hypothetical protein n=1 Tax=Photorhabdus luminescens TaxID=29488 RepID=UPI000B4C50EF|nr:hypothetical protein [Photorhabdus luminescens]OWO80391.1 hypothetical protein B5C26_17995 [Photorhabdus luminescens]